jgi:hypothetical protein
MFNLVKLGNLSKIDKIKFKSELGKLGYLNLSRKHSVKFGQFNIFKVN